VTKLNKLLPPNKEFTIFGDDINFILTEIEKMGGNRYHVHLINKRIEMVVAREELK
jgi:hypothetical protein